MIDQVLALGHRLLVDEPRRHAAHLRPVHCVHVHDQVLDHRHVAHRLDLDRSLARSAQGRVEVRVAGQRRLAVYAHAAGAADRLAARASDPDRAVEAVARLQDPLQHGAVRLELDGVLVPVGGLARLRVIAAHPQLELFDAHQYLRSSGCHWVKVTGE